MRGIDTEVRKVRKRVFEEVANLAYRQDKIRYYDIADHIQRAMDTIPFIEKPTYEDYVETDKITRQLL